MGNKYFDNVARILMPDNYRTAVYHNISIPNGEHAHDLKENMKAEKKLHDWLDKKGTFIDFYRKMSLIQSILSTDQHLLPTKSKTIFPYPLSRLDVTV